MIRDNDSFAWIRHYGVNRPYTTNGLNQYTAAGTASYGYDANGNFVSDGTVSCPRFDGHQEQVFMEPGGIDDQDRRQAAGL